MYCTSNYHIKYQFNIQYWYLSILLKSIVQYMMMIENYNNVDHSILINQITT